MRDSNAYQLVAKIYSAIATTLVFFCCTAVSAQVVGHNNNLSISRVDAGSLQCVFSVNLLPLVHQLLSSQIAYADFLQGFSALSDAAMDNELDKMTKELSAKSFFMLPTGLKLGIKSWQLPSKQTLRDAIKVSLVMVHMPPSAASHIDPIPLQAKVTSKTPISRVQLQLHSALFPIFVAYKEDKFWLTQEIPMAVMDLN
jgi:hypothetical protein